MATQANKWQAAKEGVSSEKQLKIEQEKNIRKKVEPPCKFNWLILVEFIWGGLSYELVFSCIGTRSHTCEMRRMNRRAINKYQETNVSFRRGRAAIKSRNSQNKKTKILPLF